jgi:CO dehydrogenase nickel-insertion accessory protein CooC1
MKTDELQKLWWEWLGQSERLLRSLHEQTAAVMLRDVERVERLQPELSRLIAQLQEIDERAVTVAKRLAENLGIQHGFRSLVTVLEKAEAEQFIALSNRVKAAAQNVHAVIDKNQTLIENELAYVAGSLHLLAKAADASEGQFGQKSHAAVLLDERA